jgi:hypothetical protein
MKKSTIIYLILVAFILSLTVSVASAQDGGLPDNDFNYPPGTTLNDLHLCFDGQPWGDGRCNDPDYWISQWHWTCGYYFAHSALGLYQVDEIPEMCGAKETFVTICLVDTGDEGSISMLSNGIDGYKNTYESETCSGAVVWTDYYVYAPDETTANNLCTAAIPGSRAVDMADGFDNLEPNTLFWCSLLS